jgi:hypothetical protein
MSDAAIANSAMQSFILIEQYPSAVSHEPNSKQASFLGDG